MDFFYDSDWSGETNVYAINSIMDFSFPMHFQRSYEILYVLEGTLLVTIEQTLYEVHPGDAIFIFPQQFHMLQCREHYKGIIFLFSMGFVEDFSMAYKNMIPLNNMLHNLHIAEIPLQPTNKYHVKAVLYSLLGMLTDKTAYKPFEAGNNSKLLHLILAYIEAHYMENCSLQKASLDLGYGYTYLSRTFKEFMKMTYTVYLNKYRIQMASHMLKYRNLSLSEVSFECGYDNIRSFNHNFKKFTGYTPTEFLNQL